MLNLEVKRLTAVTPSIREIELTGDGTLPGFTAGAHIDVTLGNGIERSYSLLNDPTETHRYVLAVLREVESRGGSTFVHDHLREGDRLVSTAPINNFQINEAGENHLLIAGGIGITPLKSMTHRMLARGANFSLHYCARDRERAAYLDELTTALGRTPYRASRRRRYLARARRRGAAVEARRRRACLCLRAGRPDPRRARGGARLAEGHRPLRAVPRQRGRRRAALERPGRSRSRSPAPARR